MNNKEKHLQIDLIGLLIILIGAILFWFNKWFFMILVTGILIMILNEKLNPFEGKR